MSSGRSSGWTFKAAAAAAVVVILGAGGFVARRYYPSSAPAPVQGTLVVNTSPAGAQVFVDGQPRGASPLTLTVTPGPHNLELRGEGESRSIPITVTAGAQVQQYVELSKASATTGQLQVRSEPAGARVSVDGVARGTAPVTVTNLMPGEHLVVLEGDAGTTRQTVQVEAGATASMVAALNSASGGPQSGWVSVSAPADVQLLEGGRLVGTSQSDRVMMTTGSHQLDIVNDALGFRTTRTVQVSAGKVSALKIEFPKGTIALNAVPWAEVWIDGEKIGETPIGNYQLPLGSHEVLFRHPDLGEQRHVATVTLTAPTRLSVDMRKK